MSERVITALEEEPPLENGSSHKEIERKFLVKKIPEGLDRYPHEQILQGYAVIGADASEARVRKRGDKHFITIKSGGDMERAEYEAEIPEEAFKILWPATSGRRLEKTRYAIPHGDYKIELDVYQGKLEGLITADVEFESVEECLSFTPVGWFDKEISEDKSFKNQTLVVKGLPEEIQLRKKEIPTFSLEEGLSRLTSEIAQRLTRRDITIVAIAGGSASGKTSAVAAKLAESFKYSATIISMDDYYRGSKALKEEAKRGNIINWDQPQALNLTLLFEHLENLKEGKSIEKPIYDFKTGEPIGTEVVEPKRIIVLEGIFALHELLKEKTDIKAFVDIGLHGRIMRRLLRDVARTTQQPADILRYFAEVVEPMHEEHVESTKINADMIISNEYKPEVEAAKSGSHELQVKFKVFVDPEFLRKMGAERYATVEQIDSYYNPNDRNLKDTGEMLRIREESGRRILTYKGPKEESPYRKRPKFEFEIDEKTAKKFLSFYGDKIKVIKKERTFYALDGVLFTDDRVVKEEDGELRDLGTFIEIRIPEDPSNLQNVIFKLGLAGEKTLLESYLEM